MESTDVNTSSSFQPQFGQMSPIQDFYANQVVFLTGVTGFIGKLVVEKLLRTCPNVQKIYVLVRQKHNKTLNQRFKEIFDSECFDVLKSLDPDFPQKIQPLSGDCSQPMLGLSPQDVEVLKKEVTCVFHVAANVRFDADLRTAVRTNVRAVRDLQDVAKGMKKLRAFVHVSTAFAHCAQEEVREEFYGVDVEPGKLMDLVDAMDGKRLEAITPCLIEKWTNIYCYTKALAEEVIRSSRDDVPIAIIRPAIVIPTYWEPIPGWVERFQGFCGVAIGAGLGVIKSLHLDKTKKAYVVPADVIVNAILAIAWNVEQSKGDRNHVAIYNVTGTSPTTWGGIIDSFREYTFVYPLSQAVWYNYLQTSRYALVHRIRTFFYHTVLSYFADAALYVVGKAPMAVEKMKKINKLLDVVAYFGVKQWSFDASNVDELWNKLDSQDKDLFNFNEKDVDFESCLESCIKGSRWYLLKDPLETVPKAIRKMYVLAAIHYMCVALVMYGWFCLLSRIFSLIF